MSAMASDQATHLANAKSMVHDAEAGLRQTIGIAAGTDIGVQTSQLNRLPEKYRTPLVLCYLEGMTQEQVALRLGCPIGTVRSPSITTRSRSA